MAAPGAAGAVRVRGLRELMRDFNKMSRGIANDIAMELEEAAQPVAMLSQQYILRGGGGFPQMIGVAQSRDSDYWSAMRVGVEKGRGLVYVAPFFRSNKGTPQGQVLAVHYRFRMEGALEDKQDEVYERLEGVIDTLGHLYDFY